MKVQYNTFGVKNLRQIQLGVINATLLKHNTFVLVATGGGKSLCYQMPIPIIGMA